MSQVREITEEYRLKRVLKTAPQTTVFLAGDPRTGKEVALKLISPAGMSPSDAQKERFEGFMEVLQTLEVPGLPRILEHGFMPDGSAFVVAGLLTGQTLDAASPLQPQRATPLLAQALTTLETLGSHRLHHHNLSPENIFVTGVGAAEQTVLLGLGTAAYLAEKEGDRLLGQTRESDPYAAPEKFDAGLRSAELWRTDLYSIALVICWALQLEVQGPGTADPVVQPGPHAPQAETERLFAALSVALRREPSQRQVSYSQIRTALLAATAEMPGTQDIRTSLADLGAPVPEKTFKVPIPPELATPLVPPPLPETESATAPPPPPDERVTTASEEQLPAAETQPPQPETPPPQPESAEEITAEESLEELGVSAYETVAEMDLRDYADAMQQPPAEDATEAQAPDVAEAGAEHEPPPITEPPQEPPPSAPPADAEAEGDGLDFDSASTAALPEPGISKLVDSLQRPPLPKTEPVSPPATAPPPLPEQPEPEPEPAVAPPPLPEPQPVPSQGDRIDWEMPTPKPVRTDQLPPPDAAPPPEPVEGPTPPPPVVSEDEPVSPTPPETPVDTVAPASGPRWPVDPPVTMPLPTQQAVPTAQPPAAEPEPPPPPMAEAEPPAARLAEDKKSLLVPILAAVGGLVLLAAAILVVWYLLRGPSEELVAEPTPVPVPTAVPTPEPAELPQPVVHPQLALAEQLMDEGDPEAAREALAAISPEEVEALSDEEVIMYDQLTEATKAEDLGAAIADLRGGLDFGSIPMLKRSLEALASVDDDRLAEEPGLKEQLEHAREVLRLHSLLWRSHNAGEHQVVLERAAEMIEMLPKYSGAFNLREEHAAALQQQAEASIEGGDFDSAVDQLEAIREHWPERPGLSERIKWCRERQGMEQRMEGVLRTARNKAQAGDPEGALQVLGGVQPTEGFRASFDSLRKELEAQLAAKDAEAPKISISGGAELQYKKNQPFRIPITITDDYKVTSTAIMVKTSGRPVFAERQLVHSGGSNYFFEVTAAMHNNNSVFFYVTAGDRSGHTARLGSPEQPLELKRKRWFQR